MASALFALVVVDAVMAQAASFSTRERHELDEGHLVTRPVRRRRGDASLVGGTSFQMVRQSPTVAWRALCDAANYRRMLPAAEESTVVDHGHGWRVLRLRHRYGLLSARYHLRLQYNHESHEVAFRLDPHYENDLRSAWGFLNVRQYRDDPNRSLISWGVMAEPGGGPMGGLFRSEIHAWMMRVPSTIRRYLHGAGRHRYDNPA